MLPIIQNFHFWSPHRILCTKFLIFCHIIAEDFPYFPYHHYALCKNKGLHAQSGGSYKRLSRPVSFFVMILWWICLSVSLSVSLSKVFGGSGKQMYCDTLMEPYLKPFLSVTSTIKPIVEKFWGFQKNICKILEVFN